MGAFKMKLELRYDNPCPSYHGEEDEELQWYFPQGQFDTYQELLDAAVNRWNWRAFYRLYIEFADNYRPTKEEIEALETLNETFQKDLLKAEAKNKLLEEIEKRNLVCRLRASEDQPDKICGTYNNYYMLLKDVEENYAYQVYDCLYVAFPDDYKPIDNEVKGLEYLNEKFVEDKEQAIKW